MDAVAIDDRRPDACRPGRLPGDRVPRCGPGERHDRPVPDARIARPAIPLGDGAGRGRAYPGVRADHVDQRAAAEILAHLAARRAPQGLGRERLDRLQRAGSGRPAEGAVEEGEGPRLVLGRVLVLVVALGERHALAVAGEAVEGRDLARRPPRALDREEVEHGGGDVEGPRPGEEQQAGVVDALGHEAGRVLLGVGVGVLEDAVGHPHGQRGREAGGQDRGDARVEAARPQRLEAAAARAGDRDPPGVHVVARLEVVDGPHRVPHHVAHEARAGESRQVAEDGVLAADEVVAAPSPGAVPELAALALPHGVPAEHHVAAAHQAHGDLLVAGVGLAHRRVSAREEHRGPPLGGPVGHVHERGHVDPGKALEDELLDAIAVPRERRGDASAERRAVLRQAADQVEGLASQLRLQVREVVRGPHPRPPLQPRRVERPRALDLVREVGGDSRTLGRLLEDAKGLGRRRLRRLGRARTGQRDGERDPRRRSQKPTGFKIQDLTPSHFTPGGAWFRRRRR